MYDFAIIGSGVSGGRIAYELTAGGARCVLLEAGREFGAATFPHEEMDYSTQMFWGGGVEVTEDGRLGLLRAKCVGGTSIVNQALLDRFDDSAWGDWKARSGIDYFSVGQMAAHYDATAARMQINSIPVERYNRNARIFTQAFDKCGHQWKPLSRAQGDCKLDQGSDCMQCLGGCPRDSKQSSLVTTIRWAREQGLALESEWEAQRLEYGSASVKIIGTRRGQPVDVIAAKVVLAAGSLGNTGLLMRSGLGDKLPALGQAFSCHPQYMSYGFFAEPVDSHRGAFQSVKSEDAGFRKQGFKLENVFAPPIGTAMLLPGYGREHQERMRKYRHYASMEVAVRDEASGHLTIDKSGKVHIHKSLTDSDRAKADAGLAVVAQLFAAAGAKEVITCRQGFGLHLMGGCAIGTDAARSVVDPEFRVHGLPNLFAADSSVFPGAPGINPSFTIMALSHRASGTMLGKGGHA